MLYIKEKDGITYELNEEYASIKKCDPKKETVLIESMIDGHPVKRILMSAFEYCINLKEIQLPSTIVDICSFSFKNCCQLRSINLPNDLDYIGTHAFEHCQQLKRIEIPDSVTYLERYIFVDCESLTEIHLPIKFKERANLLYSNSNDYNLKIVLD